MLHFSHIHRLLSPKKKNFVVLLTTIKSFYISYPYSLYNLQYIYINFFNIYFKMTYIPTIQKSFRFSTNSQSKIRRIFVSNKTKLRLRRQALIITAKSATNTQTQHHEQRTRHKSLCRQPH